MGLNIGRQLIILDARFDLVTRQFWYVWLSVRNPYALDRSLEEAPGLETGPHFEHREVTTSYHRRSTLSAKLA